MNMYRPGKPVHGQPPFGPPPPQGPPFRLMGPCGVPPTGHLPPGPCGPFSASAMDSHFIHNRPPSGHFTRPHCSSFSIDHSTVNALGGRQQIGPPAESPHTQVPQWNATPVEHRPSDNSDKAGEEFLRCIAANKPFPDYLKGNMAYNLADAFKSANVLKEAVKSDPEFQKHVTRSKSHSRSRSRCKSRGKSRAKSHVRSKSRARSRARSRSRGRSKSRARGKSQARSKSRARSRSKSRSRSRGRGRSHSRNKNSHVRSKSRVRRSKSRSSSSEKNHDKDKKRKRSPSHSCNSGFGSSKNLMGNSLLEGLKLVMNSKELEERLPTLKDAILTIKASDESKKVESVPDEHRHRQHDSQEISVLENDSMLLPHDRVGSDFSWLQAQNQEDCSIHKADELEDEESFLYGNEDIGGKPANNSSTALFSAFSQTGEHANLQEKDSLAFGSQQHQNKSMFSCFGDLLDLKQPLQMTSSSFASANLSSSECEKIKNILKSLGPANISDIMVKMQGQKEGKQLSPAPLSSDPAAAAAAAAAAGLALPAVSDPNVRQALESLQSLIKATKEKRAKRDISGTSQISSEKHKASDDEERNREKQVRMSQIETLMKELEELLKQNALSFLTPVIGFYCQKCEEFIGDLNSAENHSSIHHHSNSSSPKVQMDKLPGDSKVHLHYFSSSSNQQEHPPDRRDHRDYSHHRGSGDHRNHRDYQQDWRDKRDHRSHTTGQENISLKEEMRKERMLITVSSGPTLLPNVSVKEEVNKDLQAVGSHNKAKVENTDSKRKSSKNSREKDKVKDESSDSSDSDKGKTPKAKTHKKKKKKKEKKKKKTDKS